MVKVKKLVTHTVLYILLILIVVLFISPFLWSVTSALKPEKDIVSYPPKWIADKMTLENFAEVLSKFPFLRWLLNSIVVSVIVTIIVIILDSLAGYALARLRFRGRNILFIIIISMLFIPLQVYVVPLFILFVKLNLLNTYTAMILPLTATVTGVYLFKVFFESIPRELEDAARIDGCSDFGIFYYIMLPLSKPILASVAILNFIISWNNFLLPLIVISKQELKTLPVGLAQFMGVSGGAAGSAPAYGLSLAGACMSIIPTICLFVFLQKYFVQGIATSGIKG